ncbi:MAG: hypothetical protein V3W41_22185 [Planctomycetota bacterium]
MSAPTTITSRELEAWLIDRAAQYETSSGISSAIEELSRRVRRGEHIDAASSGELDDIIRRLKR